MIDLPRKLKTDAIVEALVEIRFEHQDLWEVVVGRMASADFMKGCNQQRLPAGEMPAQMRDADLSLRYAPTIQLQRDGLLVRLGPRVMSAHVLAPYPGWSDFLPLVKAAIGALFGAHSAIAVERLGLRYINALGDAHGIGSTENLRLSIIVADQASSDFALVHHVDHGDNMKANISVATRRFVLGSIPPHAKLFADIDVFDERHSRALTMQDIASWIDKAHEVEKQCFFSLLHEDTIERLREA